MINIILCGGNGVRLWPISRKLYPKQFCKLINDKSLFQDTFTHNSAFCDKSIILTNQDHYFIAVDELRDINKKATEYILEPVGRNTAPAIAIACFGLEYDDIVLVTPSDHLIKNLVEYEKSVSQAENFARLGYLVTFGIRPSYPETGFGYIEAAGNDVVSFKEKPDLTTAEVYISKGCYYWNSGIFVFKAGVYLEELKKYSPEIYDTANIAFKNARKDELIRIRVEDMLAIPSDSVDYAVMEKSNKIKVVPSDFEWSDLGSFESLYNVLPKNENENVISDSVVSVDSHRNLVLSTGRNISTIDIDDLIIIDTQDALLISRIGSSQKIKDIIGELERKSPGITNGHLTVYRPWGSYTILGQGYRHKIKKVIVSPGGKLSLQKHYHRNEHWTVVNGTANVTLGEDTFVLRANESTYIPMGQVHRLENPGKIELVIIETQVGDYLEEDDIVRIDDKYERN